MILSQAKVFFNWSTGKDSAMALHELRRQGHAVGHLLTTVHESNGRVSMHGVRRELLGEQAFSLGLPLLEVPLPDHPDMYTYQEKMAPSLEKLGAQGFTATGFGDIFLEDLRRYREERLAELAFTCHFPLWQRDTRALAQEFLDQGFRAIVVAADLQKLDASFVGRELTPEFFADLPEGVDPCGENGEYHTFCFDGPVFSHRVGFTLGETKLVEFNSPVGPALPAGHAGAARFCYLDLRPL
ncbi:MAG TPA: adenine nucleotide alpha hydrolase [Turneriella sp.]|nr:adenine nucleotide alpha hydrolase [Turneriella sp.]HNL53396.1 adenine nucleotide alpha hydrolase [Turneriella sp.]HNN00967.1 adenine nucleotide alpha hydrolase [Turneriella sp.]